MLNNNSEYLIKNLSELDLFCFHLAKALKEKISKERKDIFLFFKGGLAAGKTTCIIHILKSLGIDEAASSPTFMGLHEYDFYLEQDHEDDENTEIGVPLHALFKFYHLDLYQKNIDLEIVLELMNTAEPIIWALEWSEKLDSETKDFLFEKEKLNHLYIYEVEINSLDGDMRKISIKTHS